MTLSVPVPLPPPTMSARMHAHFWSRVAIGVPGACWLWTRAVTTAHRIAWTLTRGPIPPGLCVCHACDTPRCCNPTHLFCRPAPMRTTWRTGCRRAAGSRAPARPTSRRRRRARRACCRSGASNAARQRGVLAERAGVSYVTISRIENGHMTPSGAMLDKLARALDLPVRELLPRIESAASSTDPLHRTEEP
jgi:DNA-binding XRE family transcriptional regulator